MPQIRRWTDKQLKAAVKTSKSVRQVIFKLGLVPAGGNYVHVQRRIEDLDLNTKHFTGQGWNVGLNFRPKEPTPIKEILVKNSKHQSFSLKRRLFIEGLKLPKCEMCGWCQKSVDGRIPVELDHINGDRYDNRLENLRILCPNCHSLQPTHRGRNMKSCRQ